MNVVLISTYELGRQPFGLASPAAWLIHAGASVTCVDLAIDHIEDAVIQSADLVAIYVPMHTATRLAIPIAQRVKLIHPRAHLCFYGLYASVNEDWLRDIGADSIIGGEFESQLVSLYKKIKIARGSPRVVSPAKESAGGRFQGSEELAPIQLASTVSLERQAFLVPDRSDLPEPAKYAILRCDGQSPRVTGYTEASRGCKHLCRHCPIVPVYRGQFRVVQKEIVLADIRQQIARGAQHITFGDPDFFNGPTHALAIVSALHQEFPDVTYDVTIKIEHLLRHAQSVSILRDTGCAFVTSAVEAVDNEILRIFDKNHTREDFIHVVDMFHNLEMVLQPTFVAFNPWISLEGYQDLLGFIAELDLIDNIPSIQYAIRLLVPAGSRLLEMPDTKDWLGAFEAERLCYVWKHRDVRVDELQSRVLGIVQKGSLYYAPASRRQIFKQVCEAAGIAPPEISLVSKPIPHLSEPWYC